MILQQQILDLLEYYKGSKMMLAIKIKSSTKTIERIIDDPSYTVQAIRKARIDMLHNRYCNNKRNL